MKVPGTIPPAKCDWFISQSGGFHDSLTLRFYDRGLPLSPGSYRVTLFSEPDAGKVVLVVRERADAGPYVGASGTVSLQQTGSSYVGTFGVELVHLANRSDGGRLDGDFSAPLCP